MFAVARLHDACPPLVSVTDGPLAGAVSTSYRGAERIGNLE